MSEVIKINTKRGTGIFLTPNSGSTFHVDTHERGLVNTETQGILYRGKLFRVNGQGGIDPETGLFEFQTWENGNTLRYVKPDDSDYYKTRGLFFDSTNPGISCKGQVAIYELLRHEIRMAISANKELFAAALHRSGMERMAKDIAALTRKEADLLKEVSEITHKRWELITEFQKIYPENSEFIGNATHKS